MRELKNLHWKIYQTSKQTAESYEGRVSKELSSYREDQLYYSQRPTRLCSMETLYNSMANSQVIFLGDFHTFDQNIRNVLRIMRHLLRNKKKFKMGLEMVKTLHQDCLDAFIDEHITEKEFLEVIEYHDSWRFPWSHYRQLFELVKKEHIPTLSLNIEGTLAQRDEFVCDVLASEIQKDPQTPILVLYGELHILPNKIPGLIRKKISKDINYKYTIIHQNIDQVYWDHLQSGHTNGIYQYNANEYCLISSPPWIKYESMIYWYESLCEDPDFDLHEYILETGMKTFSANVDDNFLQFCKQVIESLELPLKSSAIEDFKLYDHRKLDQVEKLVKKISPKTWQNFYWELIEKNRTFKLPYTNAYYCPSYSFNRIIHLVGVHICYALLLRHKKNKHNFLSAQNEERFSQFFLEEFCAYFISKIFNPHKKCDLYLDIQAAIRSPKRSLRPKNVDQLIINLLDSENAEDLKKNLKGRSLYTLYRACQIIGPLIAENLFSQMLQQRTDSHLRKQQHIFASMKLSKKTFLDLKSLILSSNMYKMQRKRIF